MITLFGTLFLVKLLIEIIHKFLIHDKSILHLRVRFWYTGGKDCHPAVKRLVSFLFF